MDHKAHLNTDHHLITVELKEERAPPQTKWDLDKADWNEWKKQLQHTLENWLEDEEHLEMDANTAAEELTKILLETAKEIIPTKNICQHSKPYMDDELRELLKECSEKKKAYYRSDPNNYRKYQDAVKNFIVKYTQSRKDHWKKFCQSLIANNQDVWKKINTVVRNVKASVVQPLRDSGGNYIYDDAKITDMLQKVHVERTHCDETQFDHQWKTEVENKVSNLLSETKEYSGEYTPESYNCAITHEEAKYAIKGMKPNRHQGQTKSCQQ